MPAVVSDSSVLIALGAVGVLALLRDFYGLVYIPETVCREVVGEGVNRPGARAVREAIQQGWLEPCAAPEHALKTQLRRGLDAGEAEAIALALGLKASLVLMDEVEGRTTAKALGLRVTGTLGILLRAKKLGRIQEVKPLLDRLRTEVEFRLARSLYEMALREAGEEV